MRDAGSWMPSESTEMCNAGLVAGCHNAIRDVEVHALSMAHVITVVPEVGVRNTARLLRSSAAPQ